MYKGVQGPPKLGPKVPWRPRARTWVGEAASSAPQRRSEDDVVVVCKWRARYCESMKNIFSSGGGMSRYVEMAQNSTIDRFFNGRNFDR